MKKICLLGLVFSFCFLFVFSACAAVITPGEENIEEKHRYENVRTIEENQIPSTPVTEPQVILKDGSSGSVDLIEKVSSTSMPTYVESGITNFKACWEVKMSGRNVPGGRAKIILPYLDGLNQSSAQGRFITILHVINSAANEYEIFSNDGTIPNRKSINLIPAGIEVEVSSFSPFYMKTSTTPENPINENVPQTGDKGLSLGIWVICLSAAFAGLMIFRNRKNKK